MAVLVNPSYFGMEYSIHSMGSFKYNLQAEDNRLQDISAIFNLTLGHPYAILLSDYPNG